MIETALVAVALIATITFFRVEALHARLDRQDRVLDNLLKMSLGLSESNHRDKVKGRTMLD